MSKDGNGPVSDRAKPLRTQNRNPNSPQTPYRVKIHPRNRNPRIPKPDELSKTRNLPPLFRMTQSRAEELGGRPIPTAGATSVGGRGALRPRRVRAHLWVAMASSEAAQGSLVTRVGGCGRRNGRGGAARCREGGGAVGLGGGRSEARGSGGGRRMDRVGCG